MIDYELVLLDLYLKEKITYHVFEPYFQNKSYLDFKRENIDLIIKKINVDDLIYLVYDMKDLPKDIVNYVISTELENEENKSYLLAEFAWKNIDKVSFENMHLIIKFMTLDDDVMTPYKIDILKRFLDSLPFVSIKGYIDLLDKVESPSDLVIEILNKGVYFADIVKNAKNLGRDKILYNLYKASNNEDEKKLIFNALLNCKNKKSLVTLYEEVDSDDKDSILEALKKDKCFEELIAIQKKEKNKKKIAKVIYEIATKENLNEILETIKISRYIDSEYMRKIIFEVINELYELKSESDENLRSSNYKEYYQNCKERRKNLGYIFEFRRCGIDIDKELLEEIVFTNDLPEFVYKLIEVNRGNDLEKVDEKYMEAISIRLCATNSRNEDVILEELDEYANSLIRYLRKVKRPNINNLLSLLVRIENGKYFIKLLSKPGIIKKESFIDFALVSKNVDIIFMVIDKLKLTEYEKNILLEKIKDINEEYNYKSISSTMKLEQIVNYEEILAEALNVGLITAFSNHNVPITLINKKRVLDYMVFYLKNYLVMLEVYYEFLTSEMDFDEIGKLDQEYLGVSLKKI